MEGAITGNLIGDHGTSPPPSRYTETSRIEDRTKRDQLVQLHCPSIQTSSTPTKPVIPTVRSPSELCRFSGARIYPGRGIRFIRSDSQDFLFLNSKCKRYFHNRLKPSKLTWTAMYRKQYKKDVAQEAVKKRRRATKKPYSRSIVGATLEVIQKKRTEKPEVRDAAREAALREIKERIKKTKDEKKVKKAEVVAKSQKSGLALKTM